MPNGKIGSINKRADNEFDDLLINVWKEEKRLMENKKYIDDVADLSTEGDHYLDEKEQMKLNKITKSISYLLVYCSILTVINIILIFINEVFDEEFMIYIRGIALLFNVIFIALLINFIIKLRKFLISNNTWPKK